MRSPACWFGIIVLALSWMGLTTERGQAQTLWRLKSPGTNVNVDKLTVKDVAVPLYHYPPPLFNQTLFDTIANRVVLPDTTIATSGQPFATYAGTHPSRSDLHLGGIAVDKVRGGVWVTDGKRHFLENGEVHEFLGDRHKFVFIPIASPTHSCPPYSSFLNGNQQDVNFILADKWPNNVSMDDTEIHGLAVDTIHGFDCEEHKGAKFLWLLTWQDDGVPVPEPPDGTNCTSVNQPYKNVLTYINTFNNNIAHAYPLDRWPITYHSAEDDVPFVDIAFDSILGDPTMVPGGGSGDRPTGAIWAIDASGVVEVFEVPVDLETLGGGSPPPPEHIVPFRSMGSFQIPSPPGTTFSGIAVDSSRPMTLSGSPALVRFCGWTDSMGTPPCSPMVGSDCGNQGCGDFPNVAGGTIIGLADDGKAYTLTGAVLTEQEIWNLDDMPPDPGVYLGVSYSAEMVRTDEPCSVCSEGWTGGYASSTARIDLLWHDTPSLCRPSDPACSSGPCIPHQPQPLIRVDFWNVCTENETNIDHEFFVTSQVIVEWCNYDATGTTPYLLSASTFNPILAPLGNPPGQACKIFATQSIAQVTGCTTGCSTVIAAPAPLGCAAQNLCQPTVPDTRTVQYLQWLYMCGGTSVPLDVNGSFKTSDAMRLAWSLR